MDREGGCIDRFLANHDVAIFVDKDQIRHRNLREMLRKRIQPEMVCQDWIANGDMSSNAFIEAWVGVRTRRISLLRTSLTSLSKYTVRCGKMLLPVQPLFFQRVELWVRSNLQRLARLVGLAQSAYAGVTLRFRHERRCDWSHANKHTRYMLFRERLTTQKVANKEDYIFAVARRPTSLPRMDIRAPRQAWCRTNLSHWQSSILEVGKGNSKSQWDSKPDVRICDGKVSVFRPLLFSRFGTSNMR